MGVPTLLLIDEVWSPMLELASVETSVLLTGVSEETALGDDADDKRDEVMDESENEFVF